MDSDLWLILMKFIFKSLKTKIHDDEQYPPQPGQNNHSGGRYGRHPRCFPDYWNQVGFLGRDFAQRKEGPTDMVNLLIN